MDLRVTRNLTRFATESRYPDKVFDFTEEDCNFGLKYAKEILDKIKTILNITQERTKENKEQENRPDDETEGDFLIEANKLKGADQMDEQNKWQTLANTIDRIITEEIKRVSYNAISNINNGTTLPTDPQFNYVLENTLVRGVPLDRKEVEFVLAANIHLSREGTYIPRDDDVSLWANHIISPETAHETENQLRHNGYSLRLDHDIYILDQVIESLMQAHPLTLEDGYKVRDMSSKRAWTKEDILAEAIQDFYGEALVTREVQEIPFADDDHLVVEGHLSDRALSNVHHRENSDINGIPIGTYTYDGYEERLRIVGLLKDDQSFMDILYHNIKTINNALPADHYLEKNAVQLIQMLDEYRNSIIHEANATRDNINNYMAMPKFEADISESRELDDAAVIIFDHVSNDYLRDGGRIFTFDTIEEAEAYMADNGLDKYGVWDIEKNEFLRGADGEIITFGTQQEADSYIANNLMAPGNEIVATNSEDRNQSHDPQIESVKSPEMKVGYAYEIENDIANLKAAIIHSLSQEDEKALFYGTSQERSATLETVANRAGASMNMKQEAIDATIQDIKSEPDLTRLYGTHQPQSNALQTENIDVSADLQEKKDLLNSITPESIESENRDFAAEMGMTLEEYHHAMYEGSDYFRGISQEGLDDYFGAWENTSYVLPISEQGKQDVRDYYSLAVEYKIDTSFADSQIETTMNLREIIADQNEIIKDLCGQVDLLKSDKESKFCELADKYLDTCVKTLQTELYAIKACTKQLRDGLVEACGISKHEFAKAYEGLHKTDSNFLDNLKHRRNILQDNINKIFNTALPVYKGLEKGNNTIINTCNKAMDKIEAVSAASKQVTTGIRNVGRAILGRPPLETNGELGTIAQSLIKPLQALKEGCQRERESFINRIRKHEKMEEKADKSREALAQKKLVNAIGKGKDIKKVIGFAEKLENAKERTAQHRDRQDKASSERDRIKQDQKRNRDER